MKTQRQGRQLGGLNAILDTNNRFIISTPREAFPLAVQISLSLFQYFGADADIIATGQVDQPSKGNKISLLLGPKTHALFPAGQFDPISLDKENGLVLRDAHGRTTRYSSQQGLGAIFLRSNKAGAVELVIWGSDWSGLRNAARLVPTLSGVGQPDFIILDKECAWKGAAGVRALGYFDSFWNITDDSVIL